MNPHNHPPRCCCPSTKYTGQHIAWQHEHADGQIHTHDAETECSEPPCPSCVEHGELAQLAECPICHKVGDQPHTDYCQM